MFDLNELFLYAKVVEYGGFAAAGRALNLPKSTLSRRVSQLEARLGARLIQRSTRQFQVTDIGQAYYRHCVAMIAEAESAEDVIAFNKSEPRGVIRLSCTTALLNYWVAPMLAQFMAQCASVELNVKSFNRKVDIISEGYDMALNLCFPPLESSELVMKVLAKSPQVLVASATFLQDAPLPSLPADLAGLATIHWGNPLLAYLWDLTGPDGATAQVAHTPRLVSDDMSTLKNAALAGVGIANLPQVVVKDELADGRLIAVLPEWQPAEGVITAVFPSRRGLMPSVRSLIDFLGDAFEAR
ncbi:HTH-type transcriptional regulator DmlR [Pseudomonas fluorescens]|uniref:LysR family transcriptional regulator n=1 Tax=Pseudomonas azotoformans TaxID=47878 RepID=A0A4Q0HPL9_PSEAZ|nr:MULTISPECIES: LysR substrate-binding domain-containing protein [Pseudomonas]KRP89942.1 LysR family transcriptional regulator [Pseudomonas lactis]KWV77442.1 HTH-type transcriptional regulator DmlR [Pseudomonas fluorescens]MBA1301509.1 LysR family transcriptional regulator [Pseudomonas carnis]MBC6624173.1 LysR family transcriptional regulator [Pseudomonas sp.]MBJ2201694.1 LysR family transcriptional regulator [Pseudomonas carnis]